MRKALAEREKAGHKTTFFVKLTPQSLDDQTLLPWIAQQLKNARLRGDALVFENERLQQRMNQFFDKIEATLRQCLRDGALASASTTPTVDAQVRASVLMAFAGRDPGRS